MTDIYTKLSSDHREVENMMNRLADTGAADPSLRVQLFPTLMKELLLHSKAEEATFYQALRQNDKARDKVQHAKKEHDEVEALLKELDRMDKATADWGHKFLKLQSSVAHHVREEEGEIYRKAREVLSEPQARELATAFEREKQELKAAV